MSTIVKMTPTVGVAPGTTTMRFGWGLAGPRGWNPYNDIIELSRLGQTPAPLPVFLPRFDRPLRWDLIGVVGGGALLVALTAGFIASAMAR